MKLEYGDYLALTLESQELQIPVARIYPAGISKEGKTDVPMSVDLSNKCSIIRLFLSLGLYFGTSVNDVAFLEYIEDVCTTMVGKGKKKLTGEIRMAVKHNGEYLFYIHEYGTDKFTNIGSADEFCAEVEHAYKNKHPNP